MTLSADEQLDLYRVMVRSRAFEEAAGVAAREGLIPGSWMSGVGQEGTIGAIAQLRPDDMITYTHRGAYCFIARGCAPRRLFAELLGRRTGYGKGKGGRHIADLEHGVFGKSGTIGGHAPIAVGLATAIQIQGDDRVVMSLFGEAASNRGTTHSAMNMASVWSLPVVWLCENNGYCGNVPAASYTATSDVAEMAAAYDMPGTSVDGNDVLAVHQAAREAVERARMGWGPSLVELKTYRTRPFTETASDSRPEDEIAEWRRRDPIQQFRVLLEERGILTGDLAVAIESDARDEMQAARAFAEQSPYPDPAEAFEDLYA